MENKQYNIINILFSIAVGIVLLAILMFNREIITANIIGASVLSLFLGVVIFYINNTVKTIYKTKFQIIIFLFCELFILLNLLLSFMRPKILWDTWQMLDMSKYVFADFGYMDQIRQHIINTHYEMAFPPIYPILMAVVNKIFDIGVNSAVFINGICSFLLITIMLKIGHKLDKLTPMAVCMMLSACGILFCKYMIGGYCNVAGYLLLALICNQLLSNRIDMKSVCIYGLLVGTGLMCRFDFLSYAPIMFLAIPYLAYNRTSIKAIISYMCAYTAVVIAVCFPWIIYSKIHFDKIFITDNGRRLWNIPDTRPTTFFTVANPALTIHDDFGMWAISFLGKMKSSIVSCFNAIIQYSLITEILFILIIFVIVLLIKQKLKFNFSIKQYVKDFFANKPLVVCVLCILGQEALFILTGYKDIRYHCLIVFFVQFICILILINLFEKVCEFGNKKTVLVILMSIFMLIGFLKFGYFRKINKDILNISNGGYTTTMFFNDEESEIYNFLKNDCKCICIYRAEDGL